jgi:hypothetical protein
VPVWVLEDFLLKFDIWVERDGPSPDWSGAMMAWIHRRMTEPFEGAKYRVDIGGWFAIVPDASDDKFASCVTFFEIGAQRLKCAEIATLRQPVF